MEILVPAAEAVKTPPAEGRQRVQGPGRGPDGHNRIFQIVMYTTAWLRYAGRQFVAPVT